MHSCCSIDVECTLSPVEQARTLTSLHPPSSLDDFMLPNHGISSGNHNFHQTFLTYGAYSVKVFMSSHTTRQKQKMKVHTHMLKKNSQTNPTHTIHEPTHTIHKPTHTIHKPTCTINVPAH